MSTRQHVPIRKVKKRPLTDALATLNTGKAVVPATVIDGQRCYCFDTCAAPLHLVNANRSTAKLVVQHPVAPDYQALNLPKLYVMIIDYRDNTVREYKCESSNKGTSAYLYTTAERLMEDFSKFAVKSYKIPSVKLEEDVNYHATSKIVADANHVEAIYPPIQVWQPPTLEKQTLENYAETFLRMDGKISYPLFKEFSRLVDKHLVPTTGEWKSKGHCPGPGFLCNPGSCGPKKVWLNNFRMRMKIMDHINEKGLSPHSSMMPKRGDVKSNGQIRTVYPVSIQSETLLREYFGVAYRNIYDIKEDNVIIVSNKTPEYNACLIRDLFQDPCYYDLTSCETQMLDYIKSYLKFADHIPPRVKMALLPPLIDKNLNTLRPECYPSGVLYTSFFGTLFTVAIHNHYFPERMAVIAGDGIVTDGPLMPIPIFTGMLRRVSDFNGFAYDGCGGFKYARSNQRYFNRRCKSRFINGRTLFLLRHQIYTELYNVEPLDLTCLENKDCDCFGDLGPLKDFRTVGYEIRCVHGNSAWKTGDVVFDAMKLVRYYLDEKKNNTNRFLADVEEFFKEIEESEGATLPDDDTAC